MPNLESVGTIGLDHYLVLSVIIFTIGMMGVLMRRNILVMLMGIELMLNSVNLSFVAFSHFLNNMNGQIMVFFVMVIAAAEVGVGLAIAVNIYKRFKRIDIQFFEQLKG